MYDGAFDSKDVAERREALDTAAHSERSGLYRCGLRIDSISEYESLPEVKPLNGTEIRFYEDGIEAVVSQDLTITEGERTIYRGILVDEKRKQIIKFHFDKTEENTTKQK